MQEVTPKWKRGGLVLVCERCSKERIPEESPEAAKEIGDFDLRAWLKARLKEENYWGRIRAINTSCMDVCARGRVTVCIEPEGEDAIAMIVHPIEDREELYRAIVRRLADDEGAIQ